MKDDKKLEEYINQQEETYNNNMSYFLNILDGLQECPGRIIVMTTNKPNVLDRALIRPGRIDHNIHFTLATCQDTIDILEFYWKEKLNFFNLPSAEKIGRFIDTPFDLLFNIYHEENISLQGVSVLSKAKYQLGAQMNLATQLFDITIDTGENKDLYYLAKQMEFYLKAI
jgi:hypothetical protein